MVVQGRLAVQIADLDAQGQSLLHQLASASRIARLAAGQGQIVEGRDLGGGAGKPAGERQAPLEMGEGGGVPGGMPVSTGVLILYADAESFSVMTSDGHSESGFNTFSAFVEEGVTICQIQSLARANDPIYEFGFRLLGGGAQQERIWRHVLSQLASQFGVVADVSLRKTCVDNRLQWSRAKNVWHNAVIRTTLALPGRWVKKLAAR